MTAPLDTAALELYEAPFKYDGVYIRDAKHHMVADDNGQDIVLRIRGCGRIQYLPDAEALQDEIGHHIAAALTEYWMRNKS